MGQAEPDDRWEEEADALSEAWLDAMFKANELAIKWLAHRDKISEVLAIIQEQGGSVDRDRVPQVDELDDDPFAKFLLEGEAPTDLEIGLLHLLAAVGENFDPSAMPLLEFLSEDVRPLLVNEISGDLLNEQLGDLDEQMGELS